MGKDRRTRVHEKHAPQQQKLLSRQPNPLEGRHAVAEQFLLVLIHGRAGLEAEGREPVREQQQLVAAPAEAVETLTEHGGRQGVVAEQAELKECIK
jgi:hypothetical protein